MKNKTKEISEMLTLKYLMEQFPTGILSVVSDTFNLWEVLKKGGALSFLKQEILARDGKTVIRPDSGDPVDIICGAVNILNQDENKYPQYKGVIELLWDIFGGTINEQGYKVLDTHIGAIYGDSITIERARIITERLKAKGFASSNVVLGVGSFTYQFNTRDTYGFAMKATYCEVNGEGREIFKDPITDDGTKKSLRGLLNVTKLEGSHGSKLIVEDRVSLSKENEGELITIFEDGTFYNTTTLTEIRSKLI